MKKNLYIIAALVSSLLVTGCFEDESESKDQNYGLKLKQLMDIPSNLEEGGASAVALSEVGDIIAVGSGNLNNPKSGKIWQTPPGSSTFVAKQIESTGVQGYDGFSAVAHSKLLNSILVCSEPEITGGIIAPSIVEFKLNEQDQYVWTNVIEFDTGFHAQKCGDVTIVNDQHLFVANAAAIDATYPAIYHVDLTEPLPNELTSVVDYSDLNMETAQLLAYTIPAIAGAKSSPEPNSVSLFLLNRGRYSIDRVTFVPDSAGPEGSVKLDGMVTMPFDKDLMGEPTAFLNWDDKTFFVATGVNADMPSTIYSLKYDSATALPTQKFMLSLDSPVLHMTSGLSRYENQDYLYNDDKVSVYASLPIPHMGRFRIAEMTYTEGKQIG